MSTELWVSAALVLAIALAFVWLRTRVAESGTHAEIPARLAKLKQDTDPTAFLGFCTFDEDALYFVHQGGTFLLDYELNSQQKQSHADAFRQVAIDLGFPVVETTYGEFPVLRVKTGSSEASAAEVGFTFAQRLFGHDEKTVIQFLP